MHDYLDSLFASWNKPSSPGAAVGVVYQGKLIYAKGFGEADVETGAPITPETVFHVASVSKQFTAYAIVLLAQEGKLSLDDDIHKYLPEVLDFGKTITIRHLIHHTSGLRDQWNLLAMAGWQLDDVITKEHIFNLVKRQKELNFEPGSTFAYCNTGYTLLAEIVARVSKQAFPTFMEQRVFKPLGMKNTLFYDDDERVVKGRAYSFQKSETGKDTYKKSILSYANVGATSLFTTVTDLAQWISNVRSPTVGTRATMTQMLERGRLTKGDTLPYAFALSHEKYKGFSYYGHSGGDAGFRAFLCYFPKEDYGFIVLSNQAEFNPNGKALEVANLYLGSENKGDKPKVVTVPTKPYQFDSTRFSQYVGSYEMAERPSFIMTYSREGNRYFGQATAQGKLEIFPSSDTTFFYNVIDAQVTFHRAKNGEVNRITHSQNGKHPGNRVTLFVATTDQKKQFVGKYYSPELETFYTITLTTDTLKLIHVHHVEAVLSVTAKDQLHAPWWFIQTIVVVRDSADKVIGLRMSNGRVRNLWFRRLPDDFEVDKWPMASK